jgi:hypothetical protein
VLFRSKNLTFIIKALKTIHLYYFKINKNKYSLNLLKNKKVINNILQRNCWKGKIDFNKQKVVHGLRKIKIENLLT